MINRMRGCDVGLLWGRLLNTVSQVGAVYSGLNLLMTAGIFYETVIKPSFGIPLWLYVLISASLIIGLLWFILSVGIRGYYRFFNQQSAVSEINRKLDILLADRAKQKEVEDVDDGCPAEKH